MKLYLKNTITMLLHFIVTCLIALITLIKEKENVSKQWLWKIWIPVDYTWFNSDSLQYHLCCWCFCSRSDQQLSSHTGQYSRERSQGMARAIQTKDDERPAGSVKLAFGYIHVYTSSQQGLDPMIWSMYCCQSPIIRSKEMWNVKFDQMMRAWHNRTWSSSW